MSKEARNSQFDFLKPAHGLFNYFTKLVEQYTKILIPSKELLSKLSHDIDNQQKIMDEVNYRVEWVKHQLRERAKEEEAVEKERGKSTEKTVLACTKRLLCFCSCLFTNRLARFRRCGSGGLSTTRTRQLSGKMIARLYYNRIFRLLATNNTGNGRCTNASPRTSRSQRKFHFLR